MRKAAFLLSTAIIASVLYLLLVKQFGSSKPAFYAKIITKKAETLFENDTVNWTAFGILIKPKRVNYLQACQVIKTNKKSLVSKETSEISRQFEANLMDEIIPHWYGTKWSFEGHTSTPGSGEIACSYFVSTTLLHAGVNVNRYQLAQQEPENEAKSLAGDGEVIEISGSDSAENIAQIKAKIKEGICFVGLGRSHVGYLLKRNDELFFIHSSYFSPGTVTIEVAAKSPVFCAYDQYFIVELSSNELFLKQWLNNQKIDVIKDK